MVSVKIPTCHNCGKKGHITPVCSSLRLSGNRQEGSFRGRGDRRFKGTNWLETEVEPSGNELEDANLHIYHVGSKARHITYGILHTSSMDELAALFLLSLLAPVLLSPPVT